MVINGHGFEFANCKRLPGRVNPTTGQIQRQASKPDGLRKLSTGIHWSVPSGKLTVRPWQLSGLED